MKKIIITLLLITYNLALITFFTHPVYAITASPSAATKPEPTDTNPLSKQINDLKDRIASKVAELKLVDRRGVIGTVEDTASTQITITDSKGDTRFIDVDEFTKFSSGSAKESFGISDMSKGTKIGVLGLYNKQTKRIMARFIDASVTNPTIIHGAVTAIDKTNFAITVVDIKKKSTQVDIENITRTQSYTKETNVVRSGFTKIVEGQRVIVVGYPDLKDASKLTATRIILFPNLSPDPKIPLDMLRKTQATSPTPSTFFVSPTPVKKAPPRTTP